MISKGEACNLLYQKSFTCYKCNKSFTSHDDVVMHLKFIHNACAALDCKNISDFKMHSSVCDNRGFVCPVCNVKFSKKYNLQIHFNKHIGVAFYVCEICRSGFQKRKHLQNHLLHVHQKNFSVPVTSPHSKTVFQECVQCSKYYKLFTEFEEHKSLCSSIPFKCHICQVIFISSSYLENHKNLEHKDGVPVQGYLALKEGKRYFCGVCYLGFFNGNILREHLKTHVTKVSYLCDVCHLSFSSDNILQEHYLQHIEEHYVLLEVIQQHSCAKCGCIFKNQEHLENHLVFDFCKNDVINNNKSTIFYNKTSNSVIKIFEKSADSLEALFNDNQQTKSDAVRSDFDISNILVYILKSGDELLNCDDGDCVVVTDKTSLFVLQRGICTSESRMPEFSNFESYPEDDDNIDASLLDNHILQILKPLKKIKFSNVEHKDNVEICNGNALCAGSIDIQFNNNSQIEEDLCNGLTVTECIEMITNETVSEKYMSDSKNLQTVPINFTNVDDNILDNLCESVVNSECENSNIANKETFKILLNDDKWTDQETLSFDESIKKVSVTETIVSHGIHICNICQQAFNTLTSLCLHMKGNHTGFDCYLCGLSFNTEDELLFHEKISHRLSFRCDMCEMTCPKEYLLKKHKCSVHGGRHLTCDICDKSYLKKNEFEIHMMIHKGEIPPSKYDICGKVYASTRNYMHHKTLHEGKGPKKKYVCNICGVSFLTSSRLKKHIVTHLRKTPCSNECHKCKMYFSYKMIAKHFESHEVP